jgi:hypothetical protein
MVNASKKKVRMMDAAMMANMSGSNHVLIKPPFRFLISSIPLNFSPVLNPK